MHEAITKAELAKQRECLLGGSAYEPTANTEEFWLATATSEEIIAMLSRALPSLESIWRYRRPIIRIEQLVDRLDVQVTLGCGRHLTSQRQQTRSQDTYSAVRQAILSALREVEQSFSADRAGGNIKH